MPELPSGVSAADNGLLGFFAGLIEEGHSQNSAINAFREAGGTGANQILRDTYTFARDYADNRPEGWGFPVDQPIPAGSHTQWPTERGEGYGYPIQVHIENLSGEQELKRTMVYSSSPLSPEEAFDIASDQLLLNSDEGETGDTARVFGASAAGAPLAYVPL